MRPSRIPEPNRRRFLTLLFRRGLPVRVEQLEQRVPPVPAEPLVQQVLPVRVEPLVQRVLLARVEPLVQRVPPVRAEPPAQRVLLAPPARPVQREPPAQPALRESLSRPSCFLPIPPHRNRAHRDRQCCLTGTVPSVEVPFPTRTVPEPLPFSSPVCIWHLSMAPWRPLREPHSRPIWGFPCIRMVRLFRALLLSTRSKVKTEPLRCRLQRR